MQTRNLDLQPAPGAGSSITAKQFLIIYSVDPTTFLDYVGGLSPNGKQKYSYFWELLRNGNNMLGMLLKRSDKNGVEYAWTELELPRGKTPFKTILFSNEMFDFLVKYQKAEVTIRFTLQELIDEALKLESGNPSDEGATPVTV